MSEKTNGKIVVNIVCLVTLMDFIFVIVGFFTDNTNLLLFFGIMFLAKLNFLISGSQLGLIKSFIVEQLN